MKNRHHKLSIICLNVFLWLAFVSCGAEKPRITEIDPHIGEPGQLLTIMGEHFGKEQEESYVDIAGVVPTRSSYRSWSDTLIVVQIPEFSESGMVRVCRKNQKSDPILFSTVETIPRAGKTAVQNVLITEVKPQSAQIGDLITIQGKGFTGNSGEGSILFTWGAEQNSGTLTGGANCIPSNTNTGGLALWNAREAGVYVPDGAASGIVRLESRESNSMPFTVLKGPGEKRIFNKVSYSIEYYVDVIVKNADLPNVLYLWVPIPVSNSNQIRKELLKSSQDPLITDYKGTSLFNNENLIDDEKKQIAVSYLVDVYSVETKIDQYSIRRTTPAFLNKWTQPSGLVPSGEKEIIDAQAKIRAEQNSYSKAKAIYNFLLNEITISGEKQTGTVLDALRLKKADSYAAALLFCALCRAANIPAVPVSGILINGEDCSTHYWAMFWVNGIGWVPVDPALGAGAAPKNFVLRENYKDYYFGNIDNLRIAFSQNETDLAPIDARSHITDHTRSYSLQNVWEESSAGLKSYSTNWSDIHVTGTYSR